MQFLAQDLHMLVSTTYPKSSSRSCIDKFCRITDLGKSHFNFSSKNYSSKVYTFFVEIVALVTKSAAKLGLQLFYFLQFYMDFTSCSQTQQRVKNHFARRPLESFEPSRIYPRF
jgi:hypothetical protein